MTNQNRGVHLSRSRNRVPEKIRLLRLRLRLVVVGVRKLPAWVRQSLALILLSRVVSYLSVWLYIAFPTWSNKIVDPFLFAHQPMPICWLIKYSSDDIAWLLVSFVMCKMSAMISNFLFIVCVIMFGWQIIDATMFWVNFKRGHIVYLDMIWISLCMVYTAIKGYKPETIAKIKSIF